MLLRQKHPGYLETKVEDRLLEADKIRKYKLEENREKLLEEVSPKLFVSSGSNKNMYNPIRGIQYKNRTNSE